MRFLNSKRSLLKLTVYCLIALLSACSTKAPTPDMPSPNELSEPQASIARITLAIQATKNKNYLQSNEYLDQAQNIQRLPELSQANFYASRAINSHYLERQDAATWFNQMSSHLLFQLEDDTMWQWQQAYSLFLAHNNEVQKALELLNEVTPLLNASNEQAASKTIWQIVSTQPTSSLNNLLSHFKTTPEIYNWLRLALINNGPENNFKHHALAGWQQQNPEHPAIELLSAIFSNLEQSSIQPIQSVAIALPLQGKFASVSQSILDGILMAYYQIPNEARPEITIIDSSAGDFLENYQALNTDLVIGPLSRTQVDSIISLGELTIPTLALNSPSKKELPANFFYLGLQAEDEAEALAQFAAQQGFKSGAILTYDSKKGQSIASAFTRKFIELDGDIQNIQTLDKNWANSLKQLLEISKSDDRARNLSKLLRSPIEFTARRRHDIEFIYTPLKYKDIRQTTPLMPFFFAEDIQVLSNSDVVNQLYSGKRDKDLNNIIFTDTFWAPASKGIKSLPEKSERSSRLYSWGADSFSAGFNLPQLVTMKDKQIEAYGAHISYNGQHKLQRSFPISLVKYGKPTQLPDSNPQTLKVN